MPKILIQLSFLCLFCSIADTKCFSYISRSQNVYLEGQKIFSCSWIKQKELLDELNQLGLELHSGYMMNLYLENIDFANGNITNVSPKMSVGWFKLMMSPKLNWLRLRAINISMIETDAFHQPIFHELSYLEIINVPLRSLQFGMFKELKKLKALSLIGLQLESIEKNILTPLIKLEAFELVECGPKMIHLDNLFGAKEVYSLRIININKCNLSNTITDRTFSSVPVVETLLLEENHIETIGPNAFVRVFQTLKSLSLSKNNLTSIPKNLFRTFRSIKIELDGNPWHCDCRLEHLRGRKNIICMTPKKFTWFMLQDCPNLCLGDTKAKPTTVAPNKPTTEPPPVTQQTTEELRLTTVLPNKPTNTENQSEAIPNAREKFHFKCKISGMPKRLRIIKLTKPSHDVSPVVRVKKGELHIVTALLSNGFKLVELQHIQSNGFDEVVYNYEDSCATYSKANKSKDIVIKRKSQQNALHRFCWIAKASKAIFPSDCITFRSDSAEEGSNQPEYNEGDADAWIMTQSKLIVMTVYALSLVFTLVVGILIAVVLAKIFPGKIQGKKTKLNRSVSKMTQAANTQATVNRKKSIGSPIHHSRGSREHWPQPTSMDVTKFDESEEPEYESIGEILPPLPARNKPVTSNNDSLKCCDSENCTCYSEPYF